MGQHLLLDENLSERLLPLLIDRFPGSTHVRLVGLGGASDSAIWEWAREQAQLLVTKDEDFLDLSVARGFDPIAVPAWQIRSATNGASGEPGNSFGRNSGQLSSEGAQFCLLSVIILTRERRSSATTSAPCSISPA
jgi:hypothetical protein